MDTENSLDSVVHATDASFNEEISSSVPVMVDFWAPWCAPCRVMGQTLDQVAPEMAGKVKIIKVNVDENPESAARFGIRSIPSLVFFKEAEPVGMITGALPPDTLRNVLESHSRGELPRN